MEFLEQNNIPEYSQDEVSISSQPNEDVYIKQINQIGNTFFGLFLFLLVITLLFLRIGHRQQQTAGKHQHDSSLNEQIQTLERIWKMPATKEY